MMKHCPSGEVLLTLGKKWQLNILRLISVGRTKRFNEIYRELKPISSRTLSKRLVELEKQKIILKKIYREIPPKVEYSLTTKGKELIICFEHLDKWTKKYMN